MSDPVYHTFEFVEDCGIPKPQNFISMLFQNLRTSSIIMNCITMLSTV